MDSSLIDIPLSRLALAFIPIAVLLVIMLRWSLNSMDGLYAVLRMLLQLLLIGFALNWIFAGDSALIVMTVLAVMLCAASWIALRPLGEARTRNLGYAFLAVSISGGSVLALITLGVLQVSPWFDARVVIPLGGMIFASSMNAVSIAAERFASETERREKTESAKRSALEAALIPLLNSLLAVGLVSLPGMMTGQILAGVDPLLAARYQIMVMCMLTGAAGIAAALYLQLAARKREQKP